MSKRYLVQNITIKEARYDSRGNDLRKAIEKNGHAVKIDDSTILNPGQSTVLDNVTQGQLKLMNEGYISIEEKDGIGSILAQQAYDSSKDAKSNKKTLPASGGKVSQMGDSATYETEHVQAGKSSISADPRVVKPRTRTQPNVSTKPTANKKIRKGAKVS